MKFPWQRRAETAHDLRVVAEERLESAKADWPQVRREVAAIREQRGADVEHHFHMMALLRPSMNGNGKG